jgi:hypothetical protein
MAGGYVGPETVLDISHEALLRKWPRLRLWIEQENQSARHYLGLAHNAR